MVGHRLGNQIHHHLLVFKTEHFPFRLWRIVVANDVDVAHVTRSELSQRTFLRFFLGIFLPDSSIVFANGARLAELAQTIASKPRAILELEHMVAVFNEWANLVLVGREETHHHFKCPILQDRDERILHFI